VSEPTRPPHLIRFGNFELDTRAGELRKGTDKIRLGENSLHVLLTLLAQPGEVVPREELRRKLWPADTFVDFEDGLNHAVRKLREALEDEAETPRYIQTLPRRGYRFLAPVEPVVPLPAPAAPPAVGARPDLIGDRRTAVRPAQVQRWRTIALASVAALVAAGVVVALLLRAPPAPEVLGIHQITHTGHQKGTAHYVRPVIVTDGARVYFTDLVAGHPTPMAVPAAGGDAVPIPMPLKDPLVRCITPDNSELIVGSLTVDGLHLTVSYVPVLGGSARRVGDLVVHDAGDTPDGRGLVYTNGLDVYFANADGTGSRKLLSAPDGPYFLRYSPDGSHLRFSVYDVQQNRDSIWEASPDGSNLHRFLPDWNPAAGECCGTWTPDGKYYVFQATVAGSTNVWALREGRLFGRGSREPVQLTTGPMQHAGPLVSKDGKKIFFVGTQSNAELSVYDSRLHEFVPYLGGISAESVSFSKDGQWAAYVRLPEGTLW
jgi:DNA-binding winged helix-turn-helix (wHTH) protein/Tol biopolymer transport system component